MKKICLIVLCCCHLFVSAQNNYPPAPDKIYGQLLTDVQLQQVFPDGKTFVDCTPKRKVADIMYDYGMMKGPAMDIKKFVEDNFNLPPAPPQLNYIRQEKNISAHIDNLWSVLRREADVSPRWEGKSANGSSLLGLPYPYVVPGGNFREMHYAESYFIMLGLKAANDTVMIENMVKNIDYLIYNFGHVPTGNRTYYLGRSAPPFFSLMLQMLTSLKGKTVLKKYLPAMLKEYSYWMNGAADLKKGEAAQYIVKMADGTILNRYWDENNTARPENYKADTELAEAAAMELAMRIKMSSPEKLKEILDKKRNDTYRELRAAACSGWEPSSRWLAVPDQLNSIQTTSLIPVDLNCLLYSLETTIADAYKMTGKMKVAIHFKEKAAKRKAAILKYCWNKTAGCFTDYNFVSSQPSAIVTAAGLFPLFVKIATPTQAATTAKTVEQVLLKAGGLVSTANTTAWPWDAPNGFASMQWVAVTGLKSYGYHQQALGIAQRWMTLIEKVYASTGKIAGKYNVEATEDPNNGDNLSPDGFGCTNGVYAALKNMLPVQ